MKTTTRNQQNLTLHLYGYGQFPQEMDKNFNCNVQKYGGTMINITHHGNLLRLYASNDLSPPTSLAEISSRSRPVHCSLSSITRSSRHFSTSSRRTTTNSLHRFDISRCNDTETKRQYLPPRSTVQRSTLTSTIILAHRPGPGPHNS